MTDCNYVIYVYPSTLSKRSKVLDVLEDITQKFRGECNAQVDRYNDIRLTIHGRLPSNADLEGFTNDRLGFSDYVNSKISKVDKEAHLLVNWTWTEEMSHLYHYGPEGKDYLDKGFRDD